MLLKPWIYELFPSRSKYVEIRGKIMDKNETPQIDLFNFFILSGFVEKLGILTNLSFINLIN